MFNQGNVGPGQGGFSGNPFRVKRLEIWEVRFHRATATDLYIDARITDAAGTVLATSEDFVCSVADAGGCFDNGGYQTQYLGEYPTTVQDWRRLTGLEIGHNGGGGPPATRYLYFGGVAVRKSMDPNDWIGLYPVGPEAE